ncbi:MAG: helix-turn-helix domain-containing protein [Planctomycetota bacterium]
MPRSRSSAGLQKLLASCGQPVYALDERRVIVAANAACLEWLGITEDVLCGLVCEYHSQAGSSGEQAEGTASHLHPTDPRTTARALCPPPLALTGQTCQGILEIPVAQEGAENFSVLRRAAEFRPLLGVDGNVAGVIVVVAAVELDESADTGKTLTAEELHLQLAEQRRQWSGRFAWERLVGVSPAVRRARELAKVAVETSVSTVILGPLGTGREHLARCVHRARYEHSDQPLIPIHGIACDAADLESLLSRLLEQVPSTRHSLLLLDADELPVDAQWVLLRHLQQYPDRFQTLSTAVVSLHERSAKGAFLADLAAALEIVVIALPPLAQRKQDLPLLVQMLVERRNANGKRLCGGFSAEALDDLATYCWPGNLTELNEVVEQACEAAEGPVVGRGDLPALVRQSVAAQKHPPRAFEPLVLDDLLAELEGEVLRRALRAARGNKAQAARLLGISRARVIRRLEELKIVSTVIPQTATESVNEAEQSSDEIIFE